MQRLTVYSHPLRIIWQEAPIGRLLQGATPVYAKTLISRLFTLCAQAHSAAAALLLFPEEKPDMQAAQQELARETLRRALTDWLPLFSHRQATAEEWALLRRGELFVSIAIALLVICLLLLLPAANSEAHLAILSIFWGIAIMVIGLGMQVKVLALAPDATDVAMALFSGIFNIGIGAGALVGNQVSLHWSMSAIGYIGAIPACTALVWAVLIFRKWPVTLEEQPH